MNATTTVLQTDSLLFRPALPDDLERICTIIRQAQAQMRLRGSRQWQNGYPAAAHITDDIDRGYGHVLCTHTGLVVAYGAVVRRRTGLCRNRRHVARPSPIRRPAPSGRRTGGQRTGHSDRIHAPHHDIGPGARHRQLPDRHQLRQPLHAPPAGQIRLRPLRRNTLRRRSSHRIPENPLTGTSCPAKRRTGRFLPQISGCFQTPENADGRSIRPYLFVPLPPL